MGIPVERWRSKTLPGLATLALLGLGLGLVFSATGPPVSFRPLSSGATNLAKARFGLSVPSLVNETSTEQAAALTKMFRIGLRWVRVDVNWSWVQPTSASSFNWTSLEQEVGSIKAAGMRADLIIDDTPTWARPSASDPDWTEPASVSTFATFAGETAARFRPMGVTAYEIWNEENNKGFWNPAPNPKIYTAMLRDSYAAIKAVEPYATVISGGLSPLRNNGTDIAPVTFLQDMYSDGAEGSFDALGIHPYSFPALPDTYETWSAWTQMDQTSPSLRSVMAANGDAHKKIWITEMGAPSAGSGGVGAAAQAEMVTQAVQAAKSTPWIGALFIYTYQDAISNPDYYGLLNSNGRPKRAWFALAAALS